MRHNRLILSSFLFAALMCISGCKLSDDDDTVTQYTIKYFAKTGELQSEKKVDSGYKMTAEDLPVLTEDGFSFDGWYAGEEKITADYKVKSDLELTAKWTPATNTAYKVEHYLENSSDAEYTLEDTENLTGTTNGNTNAEAKTYDGYKVKSFEQTKISADGSTVVKIYYALLSKISVNLTYIAEDIEVIESTNGTVITLIPAAGFTNYTWKLNSKPLDASCSVNAATNALSFDKSKAQYGNGKYIFQLTAKKNEITYSTVMEYYFDDIVKTGSVYIRLKPDLYCHFFRIGSYTLKQNGEPVTGFENIEVDSEDGYFQINDLKIPAGTGYSMKFDFYLDDEKEIHLGTYDLNGGNEFEVKSNKEIGFTATDGNEMDFTGQSDFDEFDVKVKNIEGIDNIQYYISVDGKKIYFCGTGDMNSNKYLFLGNYEDGDHFESIEYCYISDKITSIGTKFFSNDLDSECVPNLVTLAGCKDVVSICSYAFYGCEKLKNIPDFENVKFIFKDCFNGCKSIESIKGMSKVEIIYNNVFCGCENLKSVENFTSVKEIYSNAFENCTSLTSIQTFTNVSEIDGSAFKGCTALTEIEGFNSVVSFGYSVFEGCTSLVKVSGLNKLETLPSGSFEGCTKLKTIEGFNKLSKIEEYAVKNCSSLTTFNFNGTQEQWNSITGTNYLPAGVTVTYKAN